ncbi:hypothetical protein CEXT_813151 [Caerostris extrusa]|uniref:Uncharacterized protein n=1 Tax=Caerostris extrusa TaxID=172846 RepID=A0AAV4R2U8_CAEEX|nr:hypothetical protein CEXT_813151 [Caerostris extrusa]
MANLNVDDDAKDIEAFIKIRGKNYKIRLKKDECPLQVATKFINENNLHFAKYDNIVRFIERHIADKVLPEIHELFPFEEYYVDFNVVANSLRAKTSPIK